MRFVSHAQRRAVFAKYTDSLRSVSTAGFATEDPFWVRLAPTPNPLSKFTDDYPSKAIEDITFSPLGEWGWYRPPHEIMQDDLDGDGIPLLYDINPFGSFLYGTDVPLGLTPLPNVEQLLASGRGLYDDEN